MGALPSAGARSYQWHRALGGIDCAGCPLEESTLGGRPRRSAMGAGTRSSPAAATATVTVVVLRTQQPEAAQPQAVSLSEDPAQDSDSESEASLLECQRDSLDP